MSIAEINRIMFFNTPFALNSNIRLVDVLENNTHHWRCTKRINRALVVVERIENQTHFVTIASSISCELLFSLYVVDVSMCEYVFCDTACILLYTCSVMVKTNCQITNNLLLKIKIKQIRLKNKS